jgi:phage repressor protein C with HTH and peptisase S24 domain
MTDNNRFAELIEYFITNKIVRNQQEFVEKIGSDKATVSQIKNRKLPITNSMLDKIKNAFPNVSVNWLLTGEGEMLIKKDFLDTETMEASDFVPLLPISAQAGSLNDFLVSVKDSDCETIISPVKDIDFAIRVTGDSMYPEYSSGSIILIKKINEALFIEWGKTYVLDTSNGIVVKEIHKGDNDDEIKCVSINKDPKFHPFSIKLKDIFGMYRVIMCLSMK